MKSKNYNYKALTLICLLGMFSSFNTYAVESSGNIGVYSKYVLRGIAEENSGAAVQGGYDVNWSNGFYLGWWASSLSYTTTATGSQDVLDSAGNPTGLVVETEDSLYTSTGFENDFYGGYTGKVGSWFGYTAGLIQYYYLSVDDSNLTELVLAADFKYVALQAQYLINDGAWGNSGDIYWTLGGDYDIPADFNVGFSLGYYTYSDDDAGNSKADLGTTQTSAFRHLNISLSHPIGKTGAAMGVTYIIAGEDRSGNDYDDTMVLDLIYNFDI